MYINVIFKGLKLNVVGTHHPGTMGGHEEQPERESFEIEHVYFNDCDIWDVIVAFNGDQEIEELIIAKL